MGKQYLNSGILSKRLLTCIARILDNEVCKNQEYKRFSLIWMGR